MHSVIDEPNSGDHRGHSYTIWVMPYTKCKAHTWHHYTTCQSRSNRYQHNWRTFYASDAKASYQALQIVVHRNFHRSISEPKLKSSQSREEKVRETHMACDMANIGRNVRQNDIMHDMQAMCKLVRTRTQLRPDQGKTSIHAIGLVLTHKLKINTLTLPPPLLHILRGLEYK